MASQRVFQIPLVREISLVLVVKLALILALKQAFFSQPVDPEAVAGESGKSRVEVHFGVHAVKKEKTNDQ